MGIFEQELILRYLDGHEWEVREAFAYRTASGKVVLVPAGFQTDFASIPRFFWRILPPAGTYGKAAVIHDYLYRTSDAPFTRAEADGVFLEAMTDLGVGAVTRRTMWAAVRLFGGSVFIPREAQYRERS
jgi:hypothetical protein